MTAGRTGIGTRSEQWGGRGSPAFHDDSAISAPWPAGPSSGCGVAGRTHERPRHGQSAEDTSDTETPLPRGLLVFVLMCGLVTGTRGSSVLPDPCLVPMLCTPPSSGAPSHPAAFGLAYFLSLEREQSLQAPVKQFEQFEKAFSPIPACGGWSFYRILARGLGIPSIP